MSADADLDELLVRPPGEQLAWLREHGLADADGLAFLVDRATELAHGAPSTTVALCTLCAAAAEPVGLHEVAARARYLHARVCADRGEFAAALDLIDLARRHWVAVGAHVQALRTDLGRMTVLDDLGRHAEAAQLGRALIDMLDTAHSPDDDGELRSWLRAAALENVGVASGYVGRHQEALSAYAEAEQVYEALGLAADTARARANVGVELLELGQAVRALTVLRAAAAWFADADDRLWAAKCRGFVAQALQQLGRMIEALRIVEPARGLLDELAAGPEAVRLQIAPAGIYLAMGLYGEALGEAVAAAERAAEGGMRHDVATAHLLAGLAHLGERRLDRADVELARAAVGLAAVGDDQQLARVRTAQADVALGRGQRPTASALLASVTATLEAGGWAAPLAWVLLKRDDLDEDGGGELLARASRLADTLELPRLREACRLRAARRYRRAGQPEEAERLLRTLVDRESRGHLASSDLVPYAVLDPDRRAAHDELIDLVLARGGPVEDAWEISRRAKARALLDVTDAAVGPGIAAAGPDELELRRVRDRLDATYTELLDHPPDGRAGLRTRAEALERRISVLRLRAAVTDPRTAPAGPSAIAAPSGATVLAYHVIGDDVLAFVAGQGTGGDGPRVLRLAGILRRVETLLRSLAAQWTRFRIGKGFSRRHADVLVETAKSILRGLDELLLAPLRRAGLLDDDGELFVFPDGRLHHVPFHALHDGVDYLLEQHVVTILSANGWPTHERAAPERAAPLVLAVPDARAPSVVAEAEAVRAILPTARVLIGDAATSDALMVAQPPPEVLHIACHGLFRLANPLFSALRLADRWLTAFEVLDLDLAGTLVTLSACESGRYGTLSVDPVGLAWAFLAAGARGVVVTQWMVHDAVTVDVMSAFYRALAQGDPPAAALRAAQLTTAASHPHPFFWAPFTFVASPHPDPFGAIDAS